MNNTKVPIVACVLLTSVVCFPIVGTDEIVAVNWRTSNELVSKNQQTTEDHDLHRRIESVLESLKTRKLSSYDTLHVNLILDLAAMNIKELGSSEQDSALLKKIHAARNRLSLHSNVDDLEAFVNKTE